MDGQWVMMPLYNGGSFKDAWQPWCAQKNYQTSSAKSFGNLQKNWQKTSMVWNKLTFCFKFIICLLFHVEFSACCLGSIFIPSGPSQDVFKIQMQAEDFTRTIRTSCGESSSTTAGKYSRGPREIVENLVKVKFSHDLC